MALALATIGGKITAALYNALVNAIIPQGTTLVVPTSVAGTGVSVSALGKVTFTAATAVNINGCFSPSLYDNYVIEIDVSAQSVSNQIYGRLRVAGVDDATANYDLEFLYGSTSIATAVAQSALTNWTLGAGNGIEHATEVKLYAPAQARATRALVRSGDWSGAGAGVLSNSTNRHRLATAYDGFSVVAASGTITGTLRIYGYNNG